MTVTHWVLSPCAREAGRANPEAAMTDDVTKADCPACTLFYSEAQEHLVDQLYRNSVALKRDRDTWERVRKQELRVLELQKQAEALERDGGSHAGILDLIEAARTMLNEERIALTNTRAALREARAQLAARELLLEAAKIARSPHSVQNDLARAAQMTAIARALHAEPLPPPLVEGEPCPSCGAELTAKTGQYGPFVGCMNYPICTFTSPRSRREASHEAS